MRVASTLICVIAASALASCDKPKPRKPPPPPETFAPTAKAPEPMPAPPAWTTGFVGRKLAEAFPGLPQALKPCKGNTDVVGRRFGGSAPGVEIIGWGWDPAAASPVGRVLLVDADGVIVGGGETGLARPDVSAANAEISSTTTGWSAVTARVTGAVDAYGIVNGGASLCRLGHLAF